MNAEDVATYLKSHPEFFEQYAEMIADIHIPHPHSGRSIPISERQRVSLRSKNKSLDARLNDLIQIGVDNDVIGQKMHRMSLHCVLSKELAALIKGVEGLLKEDFAVPHVALRLWRGQGLELPVFEEVSLQVRALAAQLQSPQCSNTPDVETGALFETAGVRLKSFAFIPLRDGTESFGILAMGSEDERRFYPEMGTLYLTRLGELLSGALLRYLP